MTKMNLNEVFNNNKETSSGAVYVGSNDHENTVCNFIKSHDAVVGCSMYLTNDKIIKVIEDTQIPVSIIVDKCSMRKLFDKYEWKKKKYEKCFGRFNILQHKVTYRIGFFSPETESFVVKNDSAVRYLGVAESSQYLHHKFLVGCSIVGGEITPMEVLNGSYNFSKNSKLSRENILKISDEKIARHFFEEWETALVLSEKKCDGNEFSPDLLTHSTYLEIKKLMTEEDEHLNAMSDFNDRKYDADQ